MARAQWANRLVNVRFGTTALMEASRDGNEELVTRLLAAGAEVDAVSQTVRLTGTLDGGAGAILPGMSGSALFDGRTRQ